MPDEAIKASEFKQRCLALLDHVAETKATYLITKRGRPVARVVPIDETAPPATMIGTVILLSDEEEDYMSTGEVWDAEGA
ncbi:MAG TPA: type II toxin-antitoxin system Phd/YefM family antitoxin [Actinomycetota bacterium]